MIKKTPVILTSVYHSPPTLIPDGLLRVVRLTRMTPHFTPKNMQKGASYERQQGVIFIKISVLSNQKCVKWLLENLHSTNDQSLSRGLVTPWR